MESARQQQVHRLADQEQAHNQDASSATARHRRRETAAQNEFDLEQFDQRMAALGTDPRRIIMAAFAGGQIDAATMAERMQEMDRYDAAANERSWRASQRDDQRELEERRRSDDREERAARREDDRERRADDRDAARWEREQERMREDRRREDDLRREQHHRKDEEVRFHARVDLLKQAANNGHFDQVNLQADRLYAEVVGLPTTPTQTGDRTEISARPDLPAALESDDSASQVREDDA